jgi:hypothetical protein
MKKIFVMLALALGVTSAFAQNESDTVSAEKNNVTLAKDVYLQQENGDLYHGLTRKLTFDRMVPPYGLEVTYDKTTSSSRRLYVMWISVPRISWQARLTARRMSSV